LRGFACIGLKEYEGNEIMTKQPSRRALIVTLLIVCTMQMPHLAILPGTNLIATEVFPERGIQTIHSVMALPGILSVIGSILAGMLVRYGMATKKNMTVLGLSLIGFAGVIAIFQGGHFWQLGLMNVFIGTGTGIFVTTSQSIMFDSFDEKTRRFMAATQFSCINGGALVMSLICGWLITIVWYGGHLMMLITLPIAVLAGIVLPAGERIKSVESGGAERTKVPPSVYYYAFMIFIYVILYSVAAMNVSTHIEQGALGDPAMAGVATAIMMGGGVVSGLVLPRVAQGLRDHVFTVSFIAMAFAFSLMNLFASSLFVTFASMFIFGMSMSMLIPRCIFQASNLSDPSNSATVSMLVCSIASGVGHTMSPIIITNITLALGGESTRFRFQFSAFVCLAIAVLTLLYNLHRERSRS